MVPPTGFEPAKTSALNRVAVPIYMSHRGIRVRPTGFEPAGALGLSQVACTNLHEPRTH